jgi:hypothetical protein
MDWTRSLIFCTRTDSTSSILFAHLKNHSLHSGDFGSDDAEERLNCSFSSKSALHFAMEMTAMCAFSFIFSSVLSAECCHFAKLVAIE